MARLSQATKGMTGVKTRQSQSIKIKTGAKAPKKPKAPSRPKKK